MSVPTATFMPVSTGLPERASTKPPATNAATTQAYISHSARRPIINPASTIQTICKGCSKPWRCVPSVA
jgi:hypothetical protein